MALLAEVVRRTVLEESRVVSVSTLRSRNTIVLAVDPIRIINRSSCFITRRTDVSNRFILLLFTVPNRRPRLFLVSRPPKRIVLCSDCATTCAIIIDSATANFRVSSINTSAIVTVCRCLVLVSIENLAVPPAVKLLTLVSRVINRRKRSAFLFCATEVEVARPLSSFRVTVPL